MTTCTHVVCVIVKLILLLSNQETFGGMQKLRFGQMQTKEGEEGNALMGRICHPQCPVNRETFASLK